MEKNPRIPCGISLWSWKLESGKWIKTKFIEYSILFKTHGRGVISEIRFVSPGEEYSEVITYSYLGAKEFFANSRPSGIGEWKLMYNSNKRANHENFKRRCCSLDFFEIVEILKT